MYKTLKKYFIPHDQNDYQPYLLRRKPILKIVLVALLIELVILLQVFSFLPYGKFLASVMPGVLVELANAERQGNNLGILTVNAQLEEAARLKAEDMAAKGYFSHNTPDGKTPWYWLERAGYSFASAGENLAINFFDSKDINDAWMNSTGHRANILNDKFMEVGIATARGVYQGRETIFVVQFFGKPAKAAASAPLATASEPSQLEVKTTGSAPAPTSPTSPASQPEPNEVKGRENLTETEAPIEEIFMDIEGGNKIAIIEKSSEDLSLQDTLPILSQKPLTVLSSAQSIFSNPRNIANLIYFILGAVIFLALLLKIIIKARIQHGQLIFNGAFALVIIGLLMYLNYYLFLSRSQIF